jgi:hypothetical protein
MDREAPPTSAPGEAATHGICPDCLRRQSEGDGGEKP